MIKRFLGCVAAGCLGLMVSAAFVPGFQIQGDFTKAIRILIMAGITLGIINFFVKPLIDLITFPLRVITFGLFGIIVSAAIVWGIDIIFTPEITIVGLKSLFFCGVIVWISSIFVPKKGKNED